MEKDALGSGEKSNVSKILENPEVSQSIKQAGFDKLLKNSLVKAILNHPIVEKLAGKALESKAIDKTRASEKDNSAKLSKEEKFFKNLKKAPVKTLVKLAVSKTFKAIISAVIKSQPELKQAKEEMQQTIKSAMKKENLVVVKLPKTVMKTFAKIQSSLVKGAMNFSKKSVEKGKALAIATSKIVDKVAPMRR